MSLLILIPLWLCVGFAVGSINQLIFRIADKDDRAIVFGVTMIVWPITFIIDVFALFGRSVSRWLNFLDDIPNRSYLRRMRRDEKRSKIEA